MSVHKKETKRKFIGIGIGVILLIGILSIVNIRLFHMNPFGREYTFQTPSNVFLRTAGGYYVIDHAKKRIVILDADARYDREILGGSLSKDFYYASLICDDTDGSIYVSDVVYSGQGTRVSEERILRFDEKGQYIDTIFHKKYSTEDAPYQYGNIVALSCRDGVITVTMKAPEGIWYDTIQSDGTIVQQTCFRAALDVSDAVYDESRQQMIVCTRQGNIYTLQQEKEPVQIWDGKEEEIPWTLAVDASGSIYYTELLSGNIYCLREGERETLATEPSCYYTIDVSADGERMIATDYGGVWYQNQDKSQYTTGVPIRHHGYRLLVWILAGIGGILAVLLILSGVVTAIRKVRDRDQLLRIAMVLIASLLCTGTILTVVLKTMSARQNETTLRELDLMANLLIQELDVDRLTEIRKLSDYKNEEFQTVKEPLDRTIDTCYEQGAYYYYTIYIAGDGYVDAVMDYEETLTTRHPAYEWGDNYYTQTLTDGTINRVSRETSAYGTWTFVLYPVRNSQGETVAELEVGMNMDDLQQEQAVFLRELLFTTGAAVIVIIMLLLEFLFFLSSGKGLWKGTENPAEFVPLRTLIFLMYMASSLQDPFIVQLCNRLYQNQLPFLNDLGPSLPISVELLMAAVASFLAGRMVSGVGTKRLLLFGGLLSLAGYLLCGISGVYIGILIGKALIGTGMGVIYVTANTMGALGRTEEERARAFAGINAGVLSGITVGDGLGSILLSLGNYRMVYAAGAIIMVLPIIMAAFGRNLVPPRVKEEKAIHFPRFLFNWRVLPFFGLILLPFMMILSYREYFFPLYAEEHGMSEVTVGRIFLLCGLIIIYVGPYLGEFLIRRLGSKWAMVAASIAMSLNIAIYICVPCMATAIVGVVLLSTIISFAYTCQYSYFSTVPECDAYGEGNAMGIYSTVENLGQTLGPIVFSALLVQGYQQGIQKVGMGFGGLLVLYLIVLLIQRRQDGRKRE